MKKYSNTDGRPMWKRMYIFMYISCINKCNLFIKSNNVEETPQTGSANEWRLSRTAGSERISRRAVRVK